VSSLTFDFKEPSFNQKKSSDSPVIIHLEPGADLNLAPCRNDLFGLVFLLEGAIEVIADAKTFLATRHDALCISPGFSARWGKVHAPVRLLGVFFEDSELHNMNLPGNVQEPYASFKLNAVNLFRLSPRTAQQVKHEFLSLQLDNQKGNSRIAAARLRLIFEYLNAPHENKKKHYSCHTIAFLELLHGHYLDWHTVQQYADQLYISVKHLSKLVSDELGQPPKNWINNLLICEAKRRLLHTDQPIKRIADELGYGDVYRFSKVFKNFCGCAPGQFRKSSFETNIELDISYVEKKIYG
jgi:AraC-like DNA-binding protein